MKHLYCLLTLLFFLTCQASWAQDRHAQAKLDVQRALFSEQYQILAVGEQQELVIIQENTNAIGRGVAIIVSEAGRSVVSEDGLSPLAEKLNKLGWVTMLAQTPDTGLRTAMPFEAEEFSVPAQEDSGNVANDGEDATEDVAVMESTDPAEPIKTAEPAAEIAISAKSVPPSIDPQNFLLHEQYLVTKMQAMLEKSADYPGFTLVISQGTTAAWLAKIYAQETLDAPDAFVAISPYWPSREHNSQIANYLAASSMPVLDLHNAWDNEWSLQSTPTRQIAATKALKLHYRQREIIGAAIRNQQAEYLSKEIYGWLSYMGW